MAGMLGFICVSVLTAGMALNVQATQGTHMYQKFMGSLLYENNAPSLSSDNRHFPPPYHPRLKLRCDCTGSVDCKWENRKVIRDNQC